MGPPLPPGNLRVFHPYPASGDTTARSFHLEGAPAVSTPLSLPDFPTENLPSPRGTQSLTMAGAVLQEASRPVPLPLSNSQPPKLKALLQQPSSEFEMSSDSASFWTQKRREAKGEASDMPGSPQSTEPRTQPDLNKASSTLVFKRTTHADPCPSSDVGALPLLKPNIISTQPQMFDWSEDIDDDVPATAMIDRRLQELERDAKQKETLITELHSANDDFIDRIEDLTMTVEECRLEMSELTAAGHQQFLQVQDLCAELDDKERRICHLEAVLADKDKRIRELELRIPSNRDISSPTVEALAEQINSTNLAEEVDSTDPAEELDSTDREEQVSSANPEGQVDSTDPVEEVNSTGPAEKVDSADLAEDKPFLEAPLITTSPQLTAVPDAPPTPALAKATTISSETITQQPSPKSATAISEAADVPVVATFASADVPLAAPAPKSKSSFTPTDLESFPALTTSMSPQMLDWTEPRFVSPETIKKVAPVPPAPKLKLGLDMGKYGKKPQPQLASSAPARRVFKPSRRPEAAASAPAPVDPNVVPSIDPQNDIRKMPWEQRRLFGNGPQVQIKMGQAVIATVPKYMFMQTSNLANKHWTANPNATFLEFPENSTDAGAALLHANWMKQITFSNKVFSIHLESDKSDRENLQIVHAARVLGLHNMYVAHFTRKFCDRIREGARTFEFMDLVDEMHFPDNDPIYDCLVNNVALWRREGSFPDPQGLDNFLQEHPKMAAHLCAVQARQAKKVRRYLRGIIGSANVSQHRAAPLASSWEHASSQSCVD